MQQVQISIDQIDKYNYKQAAWVHFLSWHDAYKNRFSKEFMDMSDLRHFNEFWRGVVHDSRSVGFLARHQNIPVGVIRAGDVPRQFQRYVENLPECGYSSSLYLLSEFRGHGIGKALLEYSMQHLLSSGFHSWLAFVYNASHPSVFKHWISLGIDSLQTMNPIYFFEERHEQIFSNQVRLINIPDLSYFLDKKIIQAA